jgi:hypothetical protein
MAMVMVSRDQLAEEYPDENCRQGQAYREPDWTRAAELQSLGDAMAKDLFAGLSTEETERLWTLAHQELAREP